MRMIYAAVAALYAALALWAIPANAQQGNSAEHATVAAHLAERYGETRQAIGLASNGTIVEVWANLETGTWSITVSVPGDLTCLVAEGSAYDQLSEALPPGGNPT